MQRPLQYPPSLCARRWREQVRFVGTPGGDALAPDQLFDPRNDELAGLLDGASLFPGPAFASCPEVHFVLPRASILPFDWQSAECFVST